ncbi:MAG: hypothetical protein DRJ64_10955, partial [Thermoprotei archaeon]
AVYYDPNLPSDLIHDLKSKEVMIYTGWYKYLPGFKYPIIYLLGHGKRYGKFYLRVGGFRPYCYIKHPSGKYRSIFGDRLEKVELKNSPPEKIRFLRLESLRKHRYQPFEADIPFVRRFLIDVNGLFKSKEPLDLRVLIIDIETDYPVSEEIISFASNKLWKQEIKFISLHDTNKWDMIIELLSDILECDIVTGWNIKFDIEHIAKQFETIAFVLKTIAHNHFDEVDLKNYLAKYIKPEDAEQIIDSLLEHGIIRKENKYLVVSGIPRFIIEDMLDPYKLAGIIDMKEMTKKMIGKELKSWSLENAGRELVGIIKHLHTRHVRDLSYDDLMAYNVVDVIIPEEIEELYGPILYHIYLAWLLQCKLEDTEIHSVVNDIVMLNEYKRYNIVLPSKNLTKRKSGYKAAEPFGLKGVYNNIVAIDLKAAYPSCVLALNASIETRDDNGDIVAANGIRFNKKPSVFVAALKRIMTAREEIKARLKQETDPEKRKRLDIMQRALKTQAAAFSHGIFGYQYSRLFYEKIAEAITSTVRAILNHAKAELEKRGYKVIYAHTDSLYAVGSKDKIDEIVTLANKSVEEFVKQRGYLYTPQFEFKDFYPKGYIHSPARNVMVKENGEWVVTGMNLIRSDAPDFLQDLERKIIELYLEGYSKDGILREVINILKTLKEKSPDYLGIPKPLKKSPEAYKVKSAHVKAVLNAIAEYGFEIHIGEKFLMLPVTKLKSGEKGYIAFRYGEWPEGYEIDYMEYVRSVVLGKVAIMLDVNPKELKKKLEEELKSIYVGGDDANR